MNHNFYRTFNSDSSSSSTLANIKREEDGTIWFYITVMVVCVMEGYAPIEPFFFNVCNKFNNKAYYCKTFGRD